MPARLTSSNIFKYFHSMSLAPSFKAGSHRRTHFAADIKHPCAGKWYRRYAGTYGSKDANTLFDKDLAATMATAEFYSNPEQEKLFTRFHPTNPALFCSAAMHVDDGLGCSTYPPFVD
jgi:hypothetical protein